MKREKHQPVRMIMLKMPRKIRNMSNNEDAEEKKEHKVIPNTVLQNQIWRLIRRGPVDSYGGLRRTVRRI